MSSEDSSKTMIDHYKLAFEVEPYTSSELSNLVTVAFISKTEYWGKVTKRITYALHAYLSYLNAITWTSVNFKRNLSYIISTGVLDKLDPVEIVALLTGVENPGRWAAQTIVRPLDVVCQAIHEGRISAENMCKIIAYTIAEEKDPIDVRKPDWESLNSVPTNWAVSILRGDETRQFNCPSVVETIKFMT